MASFKELASEIARDAGEDPEWASVNEGAVWDAMKARGHDVINPNSERYEMRRMGLMYCGGCGEPMHTNAGACGHCGWEEG